MPPTFIRPVAGALPQAAGPDDGLPKGARHTNNGRRTAEANIGLVCG